MLKIETRESAHVKSRIKDMSVVPNVISYTGLFAAITPLSKEAPIDNGSSKTYKPILCRDVNSLIENFGDPRIDPEKYVDLYTIMQIIGNGTSCYVTKVYSGENKTYTLKGSDESTEGGVGVATVNSSLSDDLTFECKLTQAKPNKLGTFFINIDVKNSDGNVLVSAKLKTLYNGEDKPTNKTIINGLNSLLAPYANITLDDPATENDTSIASFIFDEHTAYGVLVPDSEDKNYATISNFITSNGDSNSSAASLDNYINALNQYKDKKYTGCLMADLTAPLIEEGTVTDLDSDSDAQYGNRRALHMALKEIAAERKDTTVILSTPKGIDQVSDACNWVTSTGEYSDLIEYGTTNTTDYSEQSFYLEIYYSWLKLAANKRDGSKLVRQDVEVAPAGPIANNILYAFRERGFQYPVAGDQFGTLSDAYTVISNPATKFERDQLVQSRINPIYDTGTRGVQIYGNETLNAGYTDLNAAHIARTLVNIRARVDEYTESLKFSLNSPVLWDTWKNHVSMYILDPLKSDNAINTYSVAMGLDTTTPEEIANRTIKGVIELSFFQSAEIFDLSFVVYSSATTITE